MIPNEVVLLIFYQSESSTLLSCSLVSWTWKKLVDLSFKKHSCLLVKWRRYHNSLIETPESVSSEFVRNHILSKGRKQFTSIGLLFCFCFDWHYSPTQIRLVLMIESHWKKFQLFSLFFDVSKSSPQFWENTKRFNFRHYDGFIDDTLVIHFDDNAIVLKTFENDAPQLWVDKNYHCSPSSFCLRDDVIHYYKDRQGVLFAVDRRFKLTFPLSDDPSKQIHIPFFIQSKYVSAAGPFMISWCHKTQHMIFDVRTATISQCKLTKAKFYIYDSKRDKLLIYTKDGYIFRFPWTPKQKKCIGTFDPSTDSSMIFCRHCDNHILKFHSNPFSIEISSHFYFE